MKNSAFKVSGENAKKLDIVLRQTTDDRLTEEQRDCIKSQLCIRKQYNIFVCDDVSEFCRLIAPDAQTQIRTLLGDVENLEELATAVLVSRYTQKGLFGSICIYLPERIKGGEAG